MSVLSITAPQFTVDDELLELSTLEEDELVAAEADIYGTGIFEETDEMIQLGPEELQHTIINEIPIEEKEAYLEACERCPEIVQSESNYIMFLRSENYNVWVRFFRVCVLCVCSVYICYFVKVLSVYHLSFCIFCVTVFVFVDFTFLYF